MKHRLFMALVALLAAMALSSSVAFGAATGGNRASSSGSWAMSPTEGTTPTADSDEDEGDDDTDVDEDEGDDDTDVDEDEGDDDTDVDEDEGDDDTDVDEDEGDDGTSGDHERKQNHGWFVSQMAHDRTVTGRDHGKAVSDCARGTEGKPAKNEH